MKIGVIGAGPAGIIAAGEAADGNEVYLIEKNEKIGKKLFITGKGRCNITNASPIEDFFDKVKSNRNFMYSGFYSFNNENIMDLLSGYGLEMKVERGDRVFPKSDKSSDVLMVFNKYLRDKSVNVVLNTTVTKVKKEDDKFLVLTNNGDYEFDRLIISTGGMSYPTTGSTGDGYKFGETFGHSLVKLTPGLVPIEIKEDFIKDLQGLSLKNVAIKVKARGKKVYDDFGEMIFTHYGISGPIVLPISSSIKKYLGNKIDIFIDLKPALDNKKLDERILRDFEKYSNKQIKNALDELLPQKLIPVVIYLSDISPEKTVHQISKEERERLVNNIKDLKLTFKAFRPIEEGIVTSGGISVKEVDPSTMESKITENLYFAGEVLDLDALTGGYNLQIAYSTGYLAGKNAGK